VLCLANGMAGNPILRLGSPQVEAFQRLLDRVCFLLAMKVCRDGEGVTKVVELTVKGARTEADARQVARTVGTSSLVKTALFGEDANWGRILAAVGRSGIRVDPSATGLTFDDIPVVKNGVGLGL
ncbi:MAG: ornithine acetyltransferase, partial [Nitrospiraceae bacterium]